MGRGRVLWANRFVGLAKYATGEDWHSARDRHPQHLADPSERTLARRADGGPAIAVDRRCRKGGDSDADSLVATDAAMPVIPMRRTIFELPLGGAWKSGRPSCSVTERSSKV
jgi:hypothetical protein